jgi:spermidine/putrescine-binding protein
MSLLAEEEIYVTEGWSGRIAALQEQGHDIGYHDPPNGYGWQECLFVLKGSPVRGLRGTAELHARAGDRDRGGRGAELSAGP